MNDKKLQVWLVIIFLVVVTGGTIVAAVLSQNAQPQQLPGQFVATTVPAIDVADHTFGNKSAKISVIEYGDFECPACAQWASVVTALKAKYSDQVVFVFRHFPLTQLHQNAMIAAQASEAASLQGKFWEMHDMLYAKQAEWSNEPTTSVVEKYFDVYAKAIGLDVDRFNTDIRSETVQLRLLRDTSTAEDAKIDHTPTFFINLTQIPNPNGYAPFAALLDAAIASSSRR